jgi:CDP-6-deoxy-D-xylo-4-hexulose-3-dehydrase
MKILPGTEASWFGYPVICRTPQERVSLVRFLESRGVETRPILCGNMARQPALERIPHRISGTLHGADEAMDRGLYWGIHPMLSEEDVEFVAASVREFFSRPA